ncbi:hypothetical protein NC653_031024 [Populus alba x Populus x berolinensis]|uniref:Uncharacterized protein n=1 Tax=Populus alba x Populus x berolinensis TaxID=444605 RepID=A0AAD6LXE6_9ROSI|nr:hypothetical protein NC653_031024 [Populus alba x Populus x berolinensis]
MGIQRLLVLRVQLQRAQIQTPLALKRQMLMKKTTWSNDGGGRWPFHGFVEQLIVDMFDPVWEVRHGSVMALREIVTHHGGSAGLVCA